MPQPGPLISLFRPSDLHTRSWTDKELELRGKIAVYADRAGILERPWTGHKWPENCQSLGTFLDCSFSHSNSQIAIPNRSIFTVFSQMIMGPTLVRTALINHKVSGASHQGRIGFSHGILQFAKGTIR